MVEEAPVTCDVAEDAAPWIVTDLADYPPGALVTLTGGNWVPGQTVEILVEDDGVADTERGEWSHAATVTADEEGSFTYQFNLAPWYVADYSVVATGECAEATATFTDAISVTNATVNGGSTTTVGPSASITASVTVNRTAEGDTWSSTSWQIGSGTAQCVDTPDHTGAPGTNTEIFSITAPATANTYNVVFKAFSGVGCTSTVGTATLTNGVIVTSNAAATALISPTSVVANSGSQSFTITITNTSSTRLRYVRVEAQAGFTIVSVQNTSTGTDLGTPSFISGNGFFTLATGNNGTNTGLANGSSVTVTFTANVPTGAGDYPWQVAGNSSNSNNGTSFTINPQPTVTVTAPPPACTAELTGADVNFGTYAWNGNTYELEGSAGNTILTAKRTDTSQGGCAITVADGDMSLGTNPPINVKFSYNGGSAGETATASNVAKDVPVDFTASIEGTLGSSYGPGKYTGTVTISTNGGS